MPGTQVAEPEVTSQARTAPRYRVLLHNDEITPMDVVCEVLRGVFNKSDAESLTLMYEAHHTGIALVEVVPLEHAELHVDQAHSIARGRGYPLTLSIEPAD